MKTLLALEDLDAVPVEEGDTFSLTFITNQLSEAQRRIIEYFTDPFVESKRVTLAEIQEDIRNIEPTLSMAISPGSATTYALSGRFLQAGASAYRALRGLLYAVAAAAIPIAAISYTQNSAEVTKNLGSTADKATNILWLILLIGLLYQYATRRRK